MEAETGMMCHELRIAWGPRKLKRRKGLPPRLWGELGPALDAGLLASRP